MLELVPPATRVCIEKAEQLWNVKIPINASNFTDNMINSIAEIRLASIKMSTDFGRGNRVFFILLLKYDNIVV